MKHLYEAIKNFVESKAFITAGSFSGFTMGAFLFGGGTHFELVEFAVKLVATVTTGFIGGCAGQLGKHVVDNLKSKINAKRKERSDKKAA
jgi:hypothetical protein